MQFLILIAFVYFIVFFRLKASFSLVDMGLHLSISELCSVANLN